MMMETTRLGLVLLGLCSIQGCGSEKSRSGVYYHLNVNFLRGGSFGEGRMVIKINGQPAVFFGEKFARIMTFGGTDMSDIKDLVVPGENKVTIEITPPAAPPESKKDEPLAFSINIQRAGPGEIVDSAGTGADLFDLEKEVPPPASRDPIVLQGSFAVKAGG